MDFSEHLMQEKGHGDYCYLKPGSFPRLFLAYLTDPSDSGIVYKIGQQNHSYFLALAHLIPSCPHYLDCQK